MNFKSSLIVLMLLISTATYAAPQDTISAEGVKVKSEVLIKADKSIIGATVEILSATGAILISQSLQKRKMIIDFTEVKFGLYTVRITKGLWKEEFVYMKN